MQRLSQLGRSATLVATLGLAAVAAVQLETTAGAALGGSGAPRRIFVDAGHGGTDPGAIGNGIVEKELNLEVALRLRDLLEADTEDTSGGGEWEVMMTRTTDASVPLSSRTNAANNWPADRFVSIHHNAFGSSIASGTETFSSPTGRPERTCGIGSRRSSSAPWGLWTGAPRPPTSSCSGRP